MADKISLNSCEDFSAALASKAPVPGGGGAAALAGALAAALCCMAGNLTSGKKKFADVEDDLQRMIASADALRLRFLELINMDAVAFEPLSRAYSLPKDTENYSQIMRQATLDAAAAPLEMMQCSCNAIELLKEMAEKCSRLMISDAGCGASLAATALECASMNVFVNTRLLRGDAEADAMDDEAREMLEKFIPEAQNITDYVMNKLTGGT